MDLVEEVAAAIDKKWSRLKVCGSKDLAQAAIPIVEARIVAIREELRQLMLEQPTTGERETYSDGFAQGLAYAIQRIDYRAKEST